MHRHIAMTTDGVVSTISLLLGVHAERKTAGGPHTSAAETHAHLVAVALTGVAGLLAGAASMACGEWRVQRRIMGKRRHASRIPPASLTRVSAAPGCP